MTPYHFHFLPPEILLGQKCYGYSADLWAMACSLSYVHDGRPLFESLHEVGMLFEICSLLGFPSRAVAPTLLGLPFYFL